MALPAIAYAGTITASMKSRGLEIYNELLRAKSVRLTHIWGKGATGDHLRGVALDFMVFENAAAGHFIANYVMANAKRLGVQYMMWNHRIWNVDKDRYGVWRWVPDRGNPTKNHMDHVHVSFKSATMNYVPPAGAGTTTAPKPSTKWSRADVVAMQKLLEVSPDGKWGPGTDAKAQAFRRVAAASLKHTAADVRIAQAIVDVKVDGSLGPVTRAAIARDTGSFQKILKVGVDKNWGPGTDRAFVAFHKEWRGR